MKEGEKKTVVVRVGEPVWFRPKYANKNDEYALLLNRGLVLRRIKEEWGGYYYMAAFLDKEDIEALVNYDPEKAVLPPPMSVGWTDVHVDYTPNVL